MLLELKEYDAEKVDGYEITLSNLSGLTKKLYSLTIEQRRLLVGLQPDRAEVIANGTLTYAPWSVSTGTAEVNPDYGTNATRADEVSVAVAEFTINRMIDGNSPILTIYNLEDDERVLSIPIADYALLVKGYYNSSMTNQEYLDRQDEYNMTFFLDEDGDWMSASIIVNSWRVVLNNDIL